MIPPTNKAVIRSVVAIGLSMKVAEIFMERRGNVHCVGPTPTGVSEDTLGPTSAGLSEI